METTVHLKSFNELSTIELYAILQLRAEVFVVEQSCPYQDLDEKDFLSLHLMIKEKYSSQNPYKENKLIAYTRILPKNISYPEVSIGRVVSAPSVRNKGIGKKIMHESLNVIKEKYGDVAIKIGAQVYLQNFYEGFGFTTIGEEYLEDNIPHISMLKS